MKKHTAAIAVILLFILSGIIYFIQFEIFHDLKNTEFYILQDWAFLPVQIAIVTIVVGMIVNERERRQRLSRSRTLASSFFRDFGTELIEAMLPYANKSDILNRIASIDQSWTENDYMKASADLKANGVGTHCSKEDFLAIKQVLLRNKAHLQTVSSNSVLLEHEDLTDMLWAIFHITDELTLRGDLSSAGSADLAHLNEDTERALTGLLVNWLCHMNHIKTEFPYLYLLDVAKNPVKNMA